MPLVFTVTVATAGLAAWVWSERRDDEDESSEDDNLSYGEETERKTRRGGNNNAPLNPDNAGLSQGVVHQDDLMSRVQGVIRRTPSPQQVFDTVSKKTAAGWAAAGAALASIREEDKDDYGDHNRWSEEAAIRRNVEAQSAQSASAVDEQSKAFVASVRSGVNVGGKRKTVVLVVSAESLMDVHDDNGSYRSENAVCVFPYITVAHELTNVPRLSSPTFLIPTRPTLSSSS